MDSKLKAIYEELGIQKGHVSNYKLSPVKEPPLKELEVAEIDYEGKPFVLLATVARAWREMRAASLKDEISLEPFSGFRSILHQKRLIERKLKNGKSIEVIITETAIPGFSEHHTGRAIDICAPGEFRLEEDFERTDQFAWLRDNAGKFGFVLSYPRDNKDNIIYEPWHWFFKPS